MNKDTVIITGIINGDERILKDFYRENLRPIKSYILKNSGNESDVEDVFQDALVVLYEKLRSGWIELKASIRTYFYGICKNIWRSRLRKKKKFTITDNPERYIEEVTNNSFFNEIEHKEQEHLYRKYFLKLSLGNKKILHLSFEGKSAKEIAQLTGYTEGYTRKKKFEAKKQLLTMIEKDPIYKELRVVL